MPRIDASRREFLRASAALSILGRTATPLGVNLAALGAAAAQSAAPPTDYKALVCVFLFGGNDATNMVLPTDADSWSRYQAARNQGTQPIALLPAGTAPDPTAAAGTPAALGGVLAITPKTAQAFPPGTAGTGARPFALHPLLTNVQSLFGQGKLAIVANVGTLLAPTTKTQYLNKQVPLPRSLFSHDDQQSEWQSGAAEGAQVGWGGQLGDMLVSANGSNAIFTAISTSGNAVMLAGNTVLQYQVSAAGAVGINGITATSLYGTNGGPAALRTVITSPSGSSVFPSDYAAVVNRSIAAGSTLNTALAGVTVAAPTQYTNPITGNAATNPLATQFQTIAHIIAAAPALGVKRQIFFASIGGFDTHANQNNVQPNLMAQLDHGLGYLYGTLTTLGLANSVTAFTMSEFARTFTTNGLGTDHAWGSHHFVLGGTVNGGDMYNQFPTVGVDLSGFSNPNAVGSGALIPTVAVDQYAATLGAWFGVTPTNLQTIFPNLTQFSPASLGFV
ncbi:MAG TPA: DUF1501 domain-containing protein [Burkholderiaceae bacterium]|nr:DUF1501 domain-containing protein [Burkholderiaceae bacterium]